MSEFLTYEERLMIAQGVKEHKSFGAIGKHIVKRLVKDPEKMVCDPADSYRCRKGSL